MLSRRGRREIRALTDQDESGQQGQGGSRARLPADREAGGTAASMVGGTTASTTPPDPLGCGDIGYMADPAFRCDLQAGTAGYYDRFRVPCPRNRPA